MDQANTKLYKLPIIVVLLYLAKLATLKDTGYLYSCGNIMSATCSAVRTIGDKRFNKSYKNKYYTYLDDLWMNILDTKRELLSRRQNSQNA